MWFGVLAVAGPTLERMTLPSGIPIDELDPGIRPQDDLFRHVNGRWLARTTIAADRARDSTFRILADQAENAVREIVAEAVSAPEGSEERKFGDLYASFMDTDRAELLGAQPISQALAAARAVSSIPELLETLGRLQPLGIGGLYRLFVDTDPGNPERYLVFFEQADLAAGRELLPRGAVHWRPRRVRRACAANVRAGRAAGRRGSSQASARAGDGGGWAPLGQSREPRAREDLQPVHLGRRAVCRDRTCGGGWRPWTRPLAPSTRSCSASRASAPGWPRCSPTSTFRRGGTGCAGG